MSDPARETRNAKCPCLYSAAVPLCCAEEGAVRVPTADLLQRFCLTRNYRRCELYRGFLEMLLASPDRWAARKPARGRARERGRGADDEPERS